MAAAHMVGLLCRITLVEGGRREPAGRFDAERLSSSTGRKRVAEIVDVSHWLPSEDPEWMGTRSKVWLWDPQVDGLLWLFKAVRCKAQADGSVRCFGEDWAE